MHINSERCAGCGKCLNICPLELIKRRAFDFTIEKGCIDCKICEKICPSGAIMND